MISIKELSALIRAIKKEITDDFRAFEDDEQPGIQLTVSTDKNGKEFSYQTGDNSFSGGCYGHPIWAFGAVYRDTNSRVLAKELIDQLYQGVAEANEDY